MKEKDKVHTSDTLLHKILKYINRRGASEKARQRGP